MCERVEKWREDAQPGRPQPADGSWRFAEADEDARETRVLPLAERPGEPGVRDGAESLGSGPLDERWARLGVFPSGNGGNAGDGDRTQVLPPIGSDDRTEGLPGTGGRPGPSGAEEGGVAAGHHAELAGAALEGVGGGVGVDVAL
ncbi:hypothetical protein ABZ462_29745, partial [Streptomyces albogriseolus]